MKRVLLYVLILVVLLHPIFASNPVEDSLSLANDAQIGESEDYKSDKTTEIDDDSIEFIPRNDNLQMTSENEDEVQGNDSDDESFFFEGSKKESDEYFRKDAQIDFASHVYVDTTMLYGYPTIGAAWDIGIQIDTITISAYLRYGHFFRPLGSDTGKLAVAEEFGEAGLSMKVKLYELSRFSVSLGINTGWYQQWLMLGSNAGTYNLVHNGLMIRPEASIGWRFIGWWRMELGVFYQTPLYPPYDEYQGWGCFIKII